MTCINCGNAAMNAGPVQLTGNFRDARVTVRMQGWVCAQCNYETITGGQMGQFQRLVADEYKRTNGLLTSEDLRSWRQRLRMSQKRFALHLGIGIATLKRWERGDIQSPQMDQWIRVKTDPQAAQALLEEVYKLYATTSLVATAEPEPEFAEHVNRKVQVFQRTRSTRLRLISSSSSSSDKHLAA